MANSPRRELWDSKCAKAPYKHNPTDNWQDYLFTDPDEEVWHKKAKTAPKIPPPTKNMQVGSYVFRNPALYGEALLAQDKAAHIEGSAWDVIPSGNRRLEVLGSSVLQTVLAGEWYRSGESIDLFESWGKGTICADAFLAKIAKDKHIDRWMKPALGRGKWDTKTKAIAVRALIGAVFEDSGQDLGVVRGFVGELGLRKPRVMEELTEAVLALAEARVDEE